MKLEWKIKMVLTTNIFCGLFCLLLTLKQQCYSRHSKLHVLTVIAYTVKYFHKDHTI